MGVKNRNRLSQKKRTKNPRKPAEILARATGLEPVTYGLTAKEQFGIIGLCSADSAALQYLTHIGSMAAYNLCQQSYKSNSTHTKHIVISALISYLISGLISMLISHLISSPISVLIIVLISKLISEKTPQISHLIS